MQKWSIDKKFSFCYGHRVWSQELKHTLCESHDARPKCRHLHGHEAHVNVYLESDVLENGMVTDFNHLGWLKDFFNQTIDHKFIFDINDPIIDSLLIPTYSIVTKSQRLSYNTILPDNFSDTFICNTLDLSIAKKNKQINSPEYDVLEGIILVDFVPTSENLSKWIYDIVNDKMKSIGVKTTKVEWQETPNSRASYSHENSCT